MSLTVFVTDGDQRSALAVVRALGRRGMTVMVGHHEPASLASSSRYCARHVTYPSPYRDRDAFDRFLLRFLARENVDVFVPVTDVTTRAACLHQDRLRQSCALAVPPLEAFDLVSNKARLVEYASRCGVPVPRTHVIAGRAALGAVLDDLEYPVVVKPAQSHTPTAHGSVTGGAHYAHSRVELRDLYDRHEYLARYPSLIQQRIVGRALGMFALFDRGRLVADFSHRRLREKPPAGGTSVLSESVPIDPPLREFAVRMLAPIAWHGVVMMEYKEDRRTGDVFLIEINGRFWGSLQLAIDSGVDFPWLSCQLAQGRRLDAPPPYRIGVKNRWLLGDFDHLLARLFRSAEKLNLPEGAPSTSRTVLDFLKIAQRGLHYEVISASDWRPFAHELQQYVRHRRRATERPGQARPATVASPEFRAADAGARAAVER
jgi:predicted ATP-grasp superfamily ATP-dependent carboligase